MTAWIKQSIEFGFCNLAPDLWRFANDIGNSPSVSTRSLDRHQSGDQALVRARPRRLPT
jgi:hypothetical protein